MTLISAVDTEHAPMIWQRSAVARSRQPQHRRPDQPSAQSEAYSLHRRFISRPSHSTRSHASLIGRGARRWCWLPTQVSYVVCIPCDAKSTKIPIGLTVRSSGVDCSPVEHVDYPCRCQEGRLSWAVGGPKDRPGLGSLPTLQFSLVA